MTYLDASALVALFVRESHTAAIRDWIAQGEPVLIVSSFAAAEFASAISIALRTGRLAPQACERVLGLFDAWIDTEATNAEIEAIDHRAAAGMVRRFDLRLRAPDALHLAACRRLDLPMLSFDRRMNAAAPALGVALRAIPSA